AEGPIALCEVQGYVYDAWLRMAELWEDFGRPQEAARLRAKAASLKRRFNLDFWISDKNGKGFFALALDGDKNKVDAIASNMGHLLWSGIVEEDKAPLVAATLVSEELFSGWGVRTLGLSCRGYNPVSYHNGSIWPHDNSLTVWGLRKYGFMDEAQKILAAFLDASSFFDYRLPELFVGMERQEHNFPVKYPTSCSPQAWAAGATLLFIRSLLGLEPNLPQGKLILAPVLPSRITSLRLEGVPMGSSRLSLEVRDGKVKLLKAPPKLEIVLEEKS
ncbi:hypothetical protein HKBW3S25_01494, partial [Candidatus Hakubella thermalkaliphila]